MKVLKALTTGGTVQVFLGSLLAVVVALRILGHVASSLFLWPVSAVSLALALPFLHLGWKKRLALQFASVTGFLVGADIVGLPWRISLILASIKLLDLELGRLILGPGITRFDDLKVQDHITRFVALIAVVPTVAGILGGLPISRFLHQPLAQTIVMNVFANSLGFAVMIPVVLLVGKAYRGGISRLLPVSPIKPALACALFIVISSLLFWQDKGPFLFLAFPPMVLVLLTMGLEGAVFTSVTLSIIGWIATAHGHGPIWLMRGSSLEHLLAFQAFIWVYLITALPVGALIDERRRAERRTANALEEKCLLADELEASRHLFQSFIENSPNVTFIKDADGRYVFYNQQFQKLFGIGSDTWIGRTDYDLFPLTDADTFRLNDLLVMSSGEVEEIVEKVVDPDGILRSFRSTKFAYRDVHGHTLLAGAAVDITDSIEHEAKLAELNRQLEVMAMTDALTGLFNRRAFASRAAVEVSIALRKQRPLSVIVMDIDNFKRHNDTYGHAAGDEALRVLGTVLKSCVRTGDLAARLGGEEFGFLLPDTDPPGAIKVAERIRSMLSFATTGSVDLTVSIGITTSDEGAQTWEQLLSEADNAMYQAKRSGKDRAVHADNRLKHLLVDPEKMVLCTNARGSA
jgi:diguanylate cyclase (GGDEF)-like protein/PAS domain S-box-containing protein